MRGATFPTTPHSKSEARRIAIQQQAKQEEAEEKQDEKLEKEDDKIET